MPAAVAADSAPVQVPASTTLHYRATITNAATTLAATISGGVTPSWTVNGQKLWPTKVTLAVESGDAGKVRIRFDGGAATTTVGLFLPTEPLFMELPLPAIIHGDGLVDTFSIIADVNGTRCQICYVP